MAMGKEAQPNLGSLPNTVLDKFVRQLQLNHDNPKELSTIINDLITTHGYDLTCDLVTQGLKQTGIFVYNIKEKTDFNLLHWSATLGHTQVVRLLLAVSDAQEFVCMKNKFGMTALHAAAAAFRVEAVKLFLALPYADQLVAIKNNNGQTARDLTRGNTRTEINNLLKRNKNPLNDADFTSLAQQVRSSFDNPERLANTLSCLLDSFDFKLVGELLILALKQAEKSISDIQDNTGETTLYAAAASENYQTEVVKLLLTLPDAEKLVFKPNKFNMTAFHSAATSGQAEAVELFLGLPYAGELVALKVNGLTALDLARANRHEKVVNLLKAYKK